MSFEDQIRERAYQIWEAGGMADGQAQEHWVSAEQAVRGEIATVSAEPEVILTKAAKAPAAKASAKKAASTKSVKAKGTAAPKTSRTKAKAVVEATAH